MKITRRQLLRGSGAAVASVAIRTRPSRAAEFSYKFAHGNPEQHPISLGVKAAVDKINAGSNGRLHIEVFPNGQLGLDAAMLSQVRAGAIDFYATSGVSISSAAGPIGALNAMPFVFKDYDAVWAAMDGEVGKVIRQAITKIGLRVFDKCWDSGYRQCTSSTKPITSPDDLKGMKMRVPISPINTSTFKALGSSPVTIDFNELYTALQTHIADGSETPLSFVYTGKLYEVQKYGSNTNHIWDGQWNFINPDSWSRLPKDLQDLVDGALNGEAPQERADVKAANATFQSELEKKGMVFNNPDQAPFRAVLKASGFYKEWRDKIGAEGWAALEKYTGPLT